MHTTARPLIRPELLDILACPTCGREELHVQSGAEAPRLLCPACGASYGFANGMPLLYRDDFAWAPKQRESEGWVALWKSLDLYDQEHPVDPELPLSATEGPWGDVARMFRAALFQMGLRGGERVLDIGAGEGWASYHFARRGAHAVAIDVVSDARMGLGRAWRRMAVGGSSFDLLVGDNENLPFRPGSFDFVFSSNTLHHHDHLDALFANIYKALKPGGRLIAIGDPLVPIYRRESDATDGDREKAFGIIERRRHLHEYVLAVWRAGLRDISVEDTHTYWQRNAELYPWMDRQRAAIERHAILGSTRLTKGLTWLMLRLPRPFAVALLLCLRDQSNLMISARKRARGIDRR